MKFVCQIVGPVSGAEMLVEANSYEKAARAHVSLDGPGGVSRHPILVSVSRFDGADPTPKIITIKQKRTP